MATEPDAKTLYDILGVEQGVTTAVIKRAYTRKVLTSHPNKGGSKEEFDKIQNAYEILSDPNPDVRRMYDRYLELFSPNEAYTEIHKYKKQLEMPNNPIYTDSNGNEFTIGDFVQHKTVSLCGTENKGSVRGFRTQLIDESKSAVFVSIECSDFTQKELNLNDLLVWKESLNSGSSSSGNSGYATNTGSSFESNNNEFGPNNIKNEIIFTDKNGKILKKGATVRHIAKEICPGVNIGIVESFDNNEHTVVVKCENSTKPGRFTFPEYEPIDLEVISYDEENEENEENSIIIPPTTILGALPSEVDIRRVSIEQYKKLPDKNIPLIIESEPNIILVLNGLACEVLIDNLGKLGAEENNWRKLLFIEPSESFISHKDVIAEQICFLILFAEMFFIKIVGEIDAEHTVTQGSSFMEKYDNVIAKLLHNPLMDPIIKAQLETLWNRLQEKYIQQKHRYISFVDIKSIIISGPDYVIPYFEESLKMMSNKDIKRKFIHQRWESASGPGAPVNNNNVSEASEF